MFNLTVDEAHTFFVGEQDWLVHNTNLNCFDVDEDIRAFTRWGDDGGPSGYFPDHVDRVISETYRSSGNVVSKYSLSEDEVLEAGTRFLGDSYTEIAPNIFRSADNTRQFRMDVNSLRGLHKPNTPHFHLEIYPSTSSTRGPQIPVTNNHIPIK
jgi:hypothetical protein